MDPQINSIFKIKNSYISHNISGSQDPHGISRNPLKFKIYHITNGITWWLSLQNGKLISLISIIFHVGM